MKGIKGIKKVGEGLSKIQCIILRVDLDDYMASYPRTHTKNKLNSMV
jgi:hypothetical protein